MTEAEWLACEDPRRMLDHIQGKVSNHKLRCWVEACRNWEMRLRPNVRYGPGGAGYDLDSPGGLEEAVEAWARRRSDEPVSADERCHLLRDIINPWRPVTLPPGWLTSDVLALAAAAYEDQPERECERCQGGVLPNGTKEAGLCAACGPGHHDHCGAQVSSSGTKCGCKVCWGCSHCGGTGRRAAGALDPFRLALLADALEEAGCVGHVENPCFPCGGHGTEMQAAPDRGPAPKCSFCGGKGWRDWPHPLLAHLRSPGPHVRGCWAVDVILGKE